MPRDCYEVLGVPRDADDVAIKAAHRRLVRKHHPDIDKTSGAAERFKEIQEAYEILSDKEKRAKYNHFGHAGVSGASGGPGGGNPFAGGGGGGQWQDIDPSTFDEVFGDLFGGGRSKRSPWERAASESGRGPGRARAGEDLRLLCEVPFDLAALGGTRTVTAAGNTFDVRIPPGIDSDGQLRIRGKGHPGVRGGPHGDLLLDIRVAAHPWFSRDGLDLLVEVPISIAEATLGATIDVPLLQGTAALKVPAGTSSARRLRLKGKGITNAKGTAGDYYATIQIVPPSATSHTQADALRGMCQDDPRANAPWARD